MSRWVLRINGERQEVEADADMPLLWVLRDLLGLTGTKYGCGVGACGACNVHVEGELVPACAIPVSAVAEKEVTTIEGLSADGTHPVQRVWAEEQVSQCGYCQPGQIMATVALLAKNPTPADTEIDAALERTLCRCGTYPRIRKAIRRLVQEGRTDD